jgi:L-asparaginase II
MTSSRAVVVSPVLVRHFRGGTVESFHRGRVAVVGRQGLEASIGDVFSPVFWRSAAKPFQAAAALRGGIGERFALDAADVALLCASHNGEDRHAARARAMLERAGIGEEALACGAHASIQAKVASELAARGEVPTPIRSNCSGKHAGMLLFAKAIDAPLPSYVAPEHPIQDAIRAALREIARIGVSEADAFEPAVDGCSAPTYALPLERLAHGFRELALGGGGNSGYRVELGRIRDAMMAHPYEVAGSGRFDTALMTAGKGNVVSKIGAEGVAAIGVVDRGVGIAIKIDDGAARGYEALAIELLRRLSVLDEAALEVLEEHRARAIVNFAGLATGHIEVLLP